MGLYKTLGVLLFLGVILGGFYVLLPKYMDYTRANAELEQVDQELLTKEMEVNARRSRLDDMTHDPVVIERVAREKFGLCRKGEHVAIFKDEAIFREQLEKQY